MNFESAFGFDGSVWAGAIIAFMRVVTVMFFLPIFGGEGVPFRIRVLLGLVMTIAVWPTASALFPSQNSENLLILGDATSLFIATAREVFLGFTIGFSCKIVLVATNIAASAVGVNMGFQTAATLSPIFDNQDSVFAVFKNWFVLILILALNLHHKFIEFIFESFTRIPISGWINPDLLLSNSLTIIQTCFEIGIKIAAPFLVIQFFLTLALGLLSRLVPQLNAFIVSFPLSFLVSMVLLFFSLSSIAALLGSEGVRAQFALTSRAMSAFEQAK
jgi:flagellar biosynthetic protein FliR